MKKAIIVLSALLFFIQASGQNKLFFSNPFAFQFDTTTKVFTPATIITTGVTLNIYTITTGSSTLVTSYNGDVFVFGDTLVSGDVAQIGTTGIYKITSHSSLQSTSKRNILTTSAIILEYDTSTQVLSIPLMGYPMKISNKSTGVVSVTIYPEGIMYWDVVPTSLSLFGIFKKIIVL